jgi:hypothetical protein
LELLREITFLFTRVTKMIKQSTEKNT